VLDLLRIENCTLPLTACCRKRTGILPVHLRWFGKYLLDEQPVRMRVYLVLFYLILKPSGSRIIKFSQPPGFFVKVDNLLLLETTVSSLEPARLLSKNLIYFAREMARHVKQVPVFQVAWIGRIIDQQDNAPFRAYL
jgi:hypothetical protein